MQRNVLMVTAAAAMLMLPARSVSAQTTSPCAKTGFALLSGRAILASIPEYLQADSLVQKDVAAYEVELQKLRGDLDSATRAYQEKSTLLSATQKAAEIKKLQARNDALSARATELDGKVSQRRAELEQPIETKVQAVIDGLRAALNCAVIFDVSGLSTPGGLGIASADPALNVTDRVIELLKTGGAAKPPAKPPAGGIKPPGGGGPET